MEDTETRRNIKGNLLQQIEANSDYASLKAIGALPNALEFDPQFTFENISVANDGNKMSVTVKVTGYQNKYKVGHQWHEAATPIPEEEMTDEELYEWAWTRDDFKEYAQLDMEVGWLSEIKKQL